MAPPILYTSNSSINPALLSVDMLLRFQHVFKIHTDKYKQDYKLDFQSNMCSQKRCFKVVTEASVRRCALQTEAPCTHRGLRQRANKAVKEKFRSKVSISRSDRVVVCSPAHTTRNLFKVIIKGFTQGQRLLLLSDQDIAVTSLFFEGLNIHKQHRPLCTCTISDPQCTQSAGPLTGTNLHIMSTLR